MGLLEDARNIQRKDPAARSVLEVILLYPGFHILVYRRIAHWLFEHKHFFLARWVSQRGRHKTGIEIHPGAKIGSCLFIDHGMGIVFGETAEIGNNCTIYHGALIGGITVGVMAAKHKTVRRQPAANSYVVQDSLHLTQQSDLFLYANTTRTARPKDNDRSGSDAHSGSGGSSFGGGGGKF